MVVLKGLARGSLVVGHDGRCLVPVDVVAEVPDGLPLLVSAVIRHRSP